MKYTCPMHPEVLSDKPGRCPHCGMKLMVQDELRHTTSHQEKDMEYSYRPLVIIISLITLVTVVVGIKQSMTGVFSATSLMSVFMAGFFLVFSGFKLMDVKGFAEGYTTYDLLAKRVFTYGYVYPFIELFLGLCFTVGYTPFGISLVTFLLMTFSGIGVARKLARHEKFQCACLGTFLKVPLTKVTLIEDFGMAAMALLMLILR